jgi:hypothetical protein
MIASRKRLLLLAGQVGLAVKISCNKRTIAPGVRRIGNAHNSKSVVAIRTSCQLCKLAETSRLSYQLQKAQRTPLSLAPSAGFHLPLYSPRACSFMQVIFQSGSSLHSSSTYTKDLPTLYAILRQPQAIKCGYLAMLKSTRCYQYAQQTFRRP